MPGRDRHRAARSDTRQRHADYGEAKEVLPAEYEGEPRNNEPELFDEVCWVDPTQLPQPVAAWLPDALDLRRRGDWYAEFEWD